MGSRLSPLLLRSYKGYNLVAYRVQILAAPLALGPLDLTQDSTGNDPRIIKGNSEKEVISTIDYIEAAANVNAPAEASIRNGAYYDSPVLLRSYHDYNLVGYQDQILAAPIALGPVDLNQESARMHPQILHSHSEEEVVKQIDAVRDGNQHVVAPTTSSAQPRPAKARKVNMGAGVLLRWGK